MNFLFALPIFLGILLFLVILHEFGHFVTAKLARVKVEEFAFGFPPRIFAIKYGETEYAFNWLPLGGYVKMLGEEDPSDSRSLAARPPWVRLIILAAGSAMNFFLAIVLFAVAFMLPTPAALGDVTVAEVSAGSPAEAAGLLPGDRIVRVDEREITSLADLQYSIQLNLGGNPEVTVERADGTTFVTNVEPRWSPPPGEGETGIRIDLQDPEITEVSYAFWEAVPRGIQRTFDLLTLTRNGLITTFTRDTGEAALTGPVGMFQATEAVAATGFTNLVTWVAIISLNLAIFNMLPIPMLDGGRAVFVVIEMVRGGRRISPERESMVHLAGFVFLIGMIIVVSYFDIARVVSGENPFG